jgi:outer membrane protein assembly factor BamB
VRWTYDGAGLLNDHALGADGVIYVPGGSAYVAVEVADGQELWRSNTVSGIGAIDGDGIVLRSLSATADGHELVRIDREAGQEVWRSPAGLDPGWGIVIADGTGYIPSGTDLLAFDPASGDERWRVELETRASRGASVAGGLVVLGDEGGTIYGITTDGALAWTYPTEGTTIGHPAMTGEVAYVPVVSSLTNELVALDTQSGAARWTFSSPEGVAFSPAIGVDAVYSTIGNGTLVALEIESGTRLWTYESGAPGFNCPATLFGDLVLVTTDFLHGVNADAGTESWRVEFGSPSGFNPIVLDGDIYVGCDIGELYAISGDTEAEGLATPVQ